MSVPFTVVAILAAYNEEDVIAQVVRAAIEDGVQVYVLNHRSTDKTAAEVAPFLGRGVIGIETFPPDGLRDEAATSFAWERILQRKEELAEDLDADWFIHGDADEFRESPWSGQALREGIQRVDALGYNAIDFRVLNFLPTIADPVEGDDVRTRLRFYEPGRDFDRLQVKCWKKTRQRVGLTASGGHSAEFADRRVFPVRFLLRHYPIRSQAHGERKVFRERLPRFREAERARGWHVQYDDLSQGVSFVRDPATLIRYDPEATRLDLWLRHREVERLEGVAALSQDEVGRLTAESVVLRRDLQTRTAERDALRSEHERLRAEHEVLRREHESLRVEHEGLQVEHQALLASRSWRVTAPLRAADRLFRGGSADSPPGRSHNPAGLPLGGPLELIGDVGGFWNDGWAGIELRFRVEVIQPVADLRIAGLVPVELGEGQDLHLAIGEREWTYHAEPGAFEWSVPIRLEPHTRFEFLISAGRSWRPGSSGSSRDTRNLAWWVASIHAR
jgi:hypothetical protein